MAQMAVMLGMLLVAALVAGAVPVEDRLRLCI
jgi:hypothetical protein